MALSRACLSSRVPLIVILGATGTGKTKLSIELAQKYKTEIISADSMQIYKGLNIVTAKATEEERALVPHHVLDILKPHQTYTVIDFRNKAVTIIDELLSSQRIPIVVGGTNYYIESILWKILVDDVNKTDGQKLISESDEDQRRARQIKLDLEASKKKESEFDSTKNKEVKCKPKEDGRDDGVDSETKVSAEYENDQYRRKRIKLDVEGIGKARESDSAEGIRVNHQQLSVVGEDIRGSDGNVFGDSGSEKCSEVTRCKKVLDGEDDFSDDSKLSSEYLHNKLKEVDPEMADRLHPNNRRKILRSLQVWAQSGRRHTEVLQEQHSEEGGCSIGGPLRYPDVIVFWLYCQQDVHDKRLTDRIDSMLEEGLVKELTDFHDIYNKQRIIDGQPTNYTKGIFQSIGLKEFHEYLLLNDEARQSVHGKKLFMESLENLKIATKRYARKQNKTIKNRFLGHPQRQVPHIYKLDTTDVSQWNLNVKEKALSIIESFTSNTECHVQPEEKSTGLSYIDGINPNTSHFCETCKRVFIGDHQYNIHIHSRRHQRVLKKIKKGNVSKGFALGSDGGTSF